MLRPTSRRWTTALLTAAIALWPAAVAPLAEAQQQPAVRLIDASGTIGPTDSIRLVLDVTNRTAKAMGGLRVTMSIHEPLDTRYELQRSFTGSFGPMLGSDTISIDGEIAADQRRTIEIAKPVSEISFFRANAKDRPYPVKISVRSGKSLIGSVDTYIVFFSGPPAVPLGLAMVFPLHSQPIYTRASSPTLVSSGTLERALEGRLSRIVQALEAFPELPVTIAPSGLLLDMLADMSDGYDRVEGKGKVRISADDPRSLAAANMLTRIKTLATRPATRVIATPYSMSVLPGLVKNELEDRAQAQVDAGHSRLAARLAPAKTLEGWLLPGDGAMDERTIAVLQRMRVSSMVVGSGTLRDSARGLTRATPVTLRTRTSGTVTMLARDAGLEKHLLSSDPTTVRQRFLADAAIAMQERPAAGRVLTVATPIDWAPQEGEVERLLATIVTSTWLAPTTPDSSVASIKPPTAPAELAPADIAARSNPESPSADWFGAIREGRAEIDRFSELGPPANRLAGLEQRLLIAESGDWWGPSLSDRGRDMARSIRPFVQTEFSKIKAPAPQTITLTSRDGVIPLLISSELDYPANVVIRLDSDKLRFPDGNKISQKLQPPNQQIVVNAVTRATGTFPLRVVVETPESGVVIASTRLVIRSTAYNIVGVAITAGAGVFLVGFWLIGAARRRLATA